MAFFLLKTFNSKENHSMAIENIHYVYDHMRFSIDVP